MLRHYQHRVRFWGILGVIVQPVIVSKPLHGSP